MFLILWDCLKTRRKKTQQKQQQSQHILRNKCTRNVNMNVLPKPLSIKITLDVLRVIKKNESLNRLFLFILFIFLMKSKVLIGESYL